MLRKELVRDCSACVRPNEGYYNGQDDVLLVCTRSDDMPPSAGPLPDVQRRAQGDGRGGHGAYDHRSRALHSGYEVQYPLA